MKRVTHAIIWPLVATASGLAIYLIAAPGSRSYRDSFAVGDLSEWQRYGGTWDVSDGVLRNLSGGRGDKMVLSSRDWRDFTVQSDIRFDSDSRGMNWGTAGILLRVSNAEYGVDDYNGYYVCVRFDQSELSLVRVTYAWDRVGTATMKRPARTGIWYRLRATVEGCHIDATVREGESGEVTRFTYFDDRCTQIAGTVGVRVYSVKASWKNFGVVPK
jgi:hypothetical protein